MRGRGAAAPQARPETAARARQSRRRQGWGLGTARADLLGGAETSSIVGLQAATGSGDGTQSASRQSGVPVPRHDGAPRGSSLPRWRQAGGGSWPGRHNAAGAGRSPAQPARSRPPPRPSPRSGRRTRPLPLAAVPPQARHGARACAASGCDCPLAARPLATRAVRQALARAAVRAGELDLDHLGAAAAEGRPPACADGRSPVLSDRLALRCRIPRREARAVP